MLPANLVEYRSRWSTYTETCEAAAALANELCDSTMYAEVEPVTRHNEDESSFFCMHNEDENIKIHVTVKVWVSDDDYLELPEKD